MAISTTRRATDEDIERVQAAWARFCERHLAEYQWIISPDAPGEIPPDDIMGYSTSKLQAQWQRCIARALKLTASVDITHPIVIAYGYVGRSGY